MALRTIQTSTITDSAITTDKLSVGAITVDKLASTAITDKLGYVPVTPTALTDGLALKANLASPSFTTDALINGLTVGRGNSNIASNTAIGATALRFNTTGNSNTGVGSYSLFFNNTGSYNVALGTYALYSNTSGLFNTAMGYNALQNNTSGTNNSVYGYNSGGGITTGSNNTIIGGYTGAAAPISATGSNFVVLSDGAGNVRQYFDAAGNAVFNGGGNLLVGTTSNTAVVSRAVIDYQAGGRGLGIIAPAGSSGAQSVHFFTGATQVGVISVTGTTTSYGTSSDYRLKEAVQPMQDALAKVVLLKPCTYKWKIDGSDGQGFIAHELQAVVPGCVAGDKDAVDKDGKPQYQGIDTSFLVATLAAAIQELKAIIDTQATRITALEAK